MHERAARVIEELYAERLHEHYEVLAMHYSLVDLLGWRCAT